MRNWLSFAGTDCRDYGVYISGKGVFSAPSRAYDYIQIPGRNGDMIGTERRLENVELTYPAFVYRDFATSVRGFRSFLLSQVGYKRLMDTYYPDEFRLACYAGPFEPEVLSDNKAGTFDLTFICKPQRYLLTGEVPQIFTANGSISNPTLFNARPFIRVYGTGVLGVGSESITISQADVYTDIDCDIMDAFKGTANKNKFVSVSGADFPTLAPGANGISLGTGITRVEITPRWWML